MRSLGRQLSIAAFGYGLEKVIALILVTVLVRHVDKALMGQFFVAISICSVAALFVEFGSARYLVRATAQDRSGAALHLAAVLCVRLPLMGLALLTINSVVAVVAPQLLWIYLFTSIYILSENLYYGFGSTLIGIGAIGTRVVTGLVGPICLLALVPAAVVLGWSFQRIVVLYAAATTAMAAVAYVVVVRRVGPLRLMSGAAAVRDIFAQCALLFALNVTVLIHTRIDEWMLAGMRSFREVAGYAVAYKLLEVSRSAIRPITMVLFPHFAAAASRAAWGEVHIHAARALCGAGVLGLVVSVTMLAIAPQIVPLLFGGGYPESVGITRVLFMAAPALFVGFVATAVNSSLRLDKQLLGIALASAGLNFGLNLAVIPRWGGMGAAWTTLTTESLFCISVVSLLVWKLRAQTTRPTVEAHAAVNSRSAVS